MRERNGKGKGKVWPYISFAPMTFHDFDYDHAMAATTLSVSQSTEDASV